MKKILLVLVIVTFSSSLLATCEVVSGGNKTPFNGKDIGSNSVEKKSLAIINKDYPDLNIIEKSFKGEVQTCSSCSDNYIICTK